MGVKTPAARTAERMAEAARNFLQRLDTDERRVAAWPFPSDEERRRWFYTPTDHGGMPLVAMRPSMQRLALELVASGLSRPGFVTVSTIMGLENTLDELEGWMYDFEHERGRDPARYYLRIFGEPGGAGPWSWRFGGHHVSLHHLIVDGKVRASTPCFFGADPAASPLLGGHLLRPLGATEDLGRELVRALGAKQRVRAVVSDQAPIDLVGGNRTRLQGGEDAPHLLEIWRGGFGPELTSTLNGIQRANEEKARHTREHFDAVRMTLEPKGIPASDLDDAQQQILRALLDVYVGRMPDDVAEDEASKFSRDRLRDVHFLWAGGIEPGQPHYYRIQGPQLLVEYDNFQRSNNHIHSVWRNPENDFGDDVLARHHATHHRGGAM
jgi:hypothetical protein